MQKKVKSAKTGLHVEKAEMQKAVLRSKISNPKIQRTGQLKQNFHLFLLKI